MKRAVFLDRDGVLTRSHIRDGKPYAPTTLREFEIIPDAKPVVARLRKAGFLTIVVTNQPDVATGKTSRDLVEKMHQRLLKAVPVDEIKVCYHVDADQCDCRKPKAGMLKASAAEHKIDLKKSYMVGDRWRDIDAGRAAGCRTILIKHPYDEKYSAPDRVVDSLLEAADWILEDMI